MFENSEKMASAGWLAGINKVQMIYQKSVYKNSENVNLISDVMFVSKLYLFFCLVKYI